MFRSAEVLRAPAFALVLLAAAPAEARDQPAQPVNAAPDAEDVALTPLNDLNLSKDEIPAALLAAAADPYAGTDLQTCAHIEGAIARIDAALGPDMDVSRIEADRLSTGRVAKSLVASFIPFRGVLREITGAAEQERALQAAIYAGAVRRGFLKGVGQQMGCAYPGRPAFTRVTMAPPAADARKGTKQPAKLAQTPAPAPAATVIAQPVVQPLPATRRR